jgi:mRNA interferase RelE/StbE
VASYKIILTRSAAKEIEGISDIKRRRLIVDRIASLEIDPRPPGCIKLTGEESYRIRQGEYRIVYHIEDKVLIVTVVRVGHRRDVYKR